MLSSSSSSSSSSSLSVKQALGICLLLLRICQRHVDGQSGNTSCRLVIRSPDLHGSSSVWTVPDNANATFTFTLIPSPSHCASALSQLIRSPTSLSVSRAATRSPFTSSPTFQTLCQILLQNGSCKPNLHNSLCACESNIGKFRFSLKVDRSLHRSTWRVQLGFPQGKKNQESGAGEFKLNVLFPPNVTGLTLEDRGKSKEDEGGTLTVQPGAAVHVLCTWCQGNPAIGSPRFVDHHGNDLAASSPKGVSSSQDGGGDDCRQLEHVIDHVTCDDGSGLFHCEVSRSQTNHSGLLLVECAPVFLPHSRLERIAQNGANVTLESRVRAHTSSMTKWSLFKMESSPADPVPLSQGDLKDRSTLKVSGDPPLLTVILTLGAVTSQDEGKWRLELTNEIGPGHMDFELVIDGDTTTQQQANKESNIFTTEVLFVMLAVIGGVLILIIVLVASVAVSFKRRRTSSTRPVGPPSPHSPQRGPEVSRDMSGRELPLPPFNPSPCRVQWAGLDERAGDDNDRDVADEDANTAVKERGPGLCGVASVVGSGYLHPVASASEQLLTGTPSHTTAAAAAAAANDAAVDVGAYTEIA